MTELEGRWRSHEWKLSRSKLQGELEGWAEIRWRLDSVDASEFQRDWSHRRNTDAEEVELMMSMTSFLRVERTGV